MLLTRSRFSDILKQRILILDGAMGTMIQRYALGEQDYRGEKFKHHAFPLKGNNDLLSLTQPHIISEIHEAYLEAGADIIETNTFNATQISQSDYHIESLVYEINRASAELAKRAADKYTNRNLSKPRWVAGSIGPTNKMASMSPDVNDTGYRAVSFDDLVENYCLQVTGLLDGGVDLLLIETVFDTLNAKAALYAVKTLLDERKLDMPVMVSVTITDASGRTLSGQTPEAFWISIAHADISAVGINCALGASDMRPYLHEMSERCWTYLSCYPNAGLPNELGQYDETPKEMASVMETFCKDGFINIMGGCCGTTPDHIRLFSHIAERYAPRVPPQLIFKS